MKTVFLSVACASLSALAGDLADFQLGRELLKEGNPELAAVEFRRYAMESDGSQDKGMSYLHAAYAYLRAGKLEDAQQMLQTAETLVPDCREIPILNGEIAAGLQDIPTALYFLDTPPLSDSSIEQFRVRRLAELQLRSGDADQAIQVLQSSPQDQSAALNAVGLYRNSKKKSPKIGGLLGLIPGAGYWYSGETANGFRSLILNGLFMYGMAQTAQDEQWGALAVISFFEVTWYSGSIYGGIDAAHRYNNNLLEGCVDRMQVPDLRPNSEITIPLFQFKVLF
jgi:tetratricopeptide (TPR) repeat protein